MTRWGVATIMNGQVAGVTGGFRLRHTAERAARRMRAEVDLTDQPVEGYRVVRRTSAHGGDWGVRPGTPLTYAHPPGDSAVLPSADEPEADEAEADNAPSGDDSVRR
jgi:hypothetical protein